MTIQQDIIKFTTTNTVDMVIADPKLNEEFLELFHQIFEYYPECSTCGKLVEEYNKLRNWANGKLNYTPKSMANFILKKGKQIYVRSLQNMVTEFNLTDRVALIMLRESKGNINNFETAPADWEDQVAGLEAQPIPEIEAITLQNEEPTTETVVESEEVVQESEMAPAVEEEVNQAPAPQANNKSNRRR